MNESEPVLETRDKSMGCLAVGFAVLTVVLFVTSHFDPKSKPPTLAGTVFIFLLGFGIAAYLAARAKRDYLRADSQGLLVSTVWRQFFVPYEEIEDYFLLKLTNSSATRTVTRSYIVWRGQTLLLCHPSEAIEQRIEERALNALAQNFEVRDREPTHLILPATFAYQKALVTRLRVLGTCLGVIIFCGVAQWMLIREIGWQFFDPGGRFGFFLVPFLLTASLPFWLPSACKNIWFLWRHRKQTLTINQLGLRLSDGEDVQFLAWQQIERLEITPVPKRLTQHSYRVIGENKTLQWNELLPGKHTALIEEQLAPRGLKWEKTTTALRHFDGMWQEGGRRFFSGFNVSCRLFTRMWLAFCVLMPGTMILNALWFDTENWRDTLLFMIYFPINVAPLMTLFSWAWSRHTLYIYDESGLEYRGMFGHKFIAWSEAQGWRNDAILAKNGRKIIVMTSLASSSYSTRELRKQIDQQISNTT